MNKLLPQRDSRSYAAKSFIQVFLNTQNTFAGESFSPYCITQSESRQFRV